jgi:arylsulfatase A-like enzyme
MNVIFIMNDSFRRDHLGCYGNSWIHTPNLDHFAEQAAVFEQYYIASYPTVPNRWDLSTGRFGFPFRGWQPLAPEDITWGHLLSDHGIHTQMIWDTPMLASDSYNYSRGFAGQTYVHGQKGDPWITNPSLDIRMPAQPHKILSMPSLATYLRNMADRRYERQYCVGRTVSAAMDWLETNHNHDSFFLWVDMWDPHEPFDCPWYDYELYGNPGYTGDRMLYPEYGRPTYMDATELEDARHRYAGNCTLVDRWIGRLLDLAKRLGLLKNTLILWTTDHGHLFGEHDLQGKPGAELGILYEITAHIPLLVYHPEGLGAGERLRGIVQPPDILPSILEFLDIPVPQHVQGSSFWPLMRGETETRRRYAFSSRFPPFAGDASYTPVEGALFDGWKGSDRIVEPSTVTDSEWAFSCGTAGDASRLFHLPTDPEQERNVVENHPQVAERMRAAWLDFLGTHGAPRSRIGPYIEADADIHTPAEGTLYAFRDDRGQWVGFPTRREALARAYQENAPGPKRDINEVTFGELLQDNPKNLIHLYGQYYWASDLL